jgi:integrase
MTTPRVIVVAPSGRRFLQLVCNNHPSGGKVTKSAKTAVRREAERAAAAWEAELKSGVSNDPFKVLWSKALEEYTAEHLSSLKPGSRSKPLSHLLLYEEHLHPRVMADVTAKSISSHARWLRATKSHNGKSRTETTIEGHVVSLKAFLNWCKGIGYVHEVPTMPTFERSRFRMGRMKGRPLTDDEFRRMLDAVPKVIDREPERFEKLLTGLWLGGFRLGEALELSWSGDTGMTLDFSGTHPMVRIEAESEKGFQDRVLPVAPDFAEFVRNDPRNGSVFPLPEKERYKADGWSVELVSEKISLIGKAAGVVVNRTGKFASAHDLRRSFGLRWADRITPAKLMALMRHQDIATTMKYYVGEDANRIAESLWTGYTSGYTAKTGETGVSQVVDGKAFENRGL